MNKYKEDIDKLIKFLKEKGTIGCQIQQLHYNGEWSLSNGAKSLILTNLNFTSSLLKGLLNNLADINLLNPIDYSSEYSNLPMRKYELGYKLFDFSFDKNYVFYAKEFSKKIKKLIKWLKVS